MTPGPSRGEQNLDQCSGVRSDGYMAVFQDDDGVTGLGFRDLGFRDLEIRDLRVRGLGVK